MRRILILMTALAFLAACHQPSGGYKRTKKKIKPGKPIPCPVKDC